MFRRPVFTLAAVLAAASACTDNPTQTQEPPDIDAQHGARHNDGAPPPTGLATVHLAGNTLSLWPYLGTSFSAPGSDPVNLVFAGQADPLAVRSALMALDGNRAAFGFPASPPFDCRWSDTPSGDIQVTWNGETGWQGSAIQLQCGDYGPVRFHLRLVRSGTWTLGGAHFEVLIPGTAEHQVLSWELAEQLVTADLLRTGLLDATAPVTSSDVISQTPSFRAIPSVIFNALPPELQAVAAGAPGNTSADVPLASDGRATILQVAGTPASAPQDVRRQFTITYGQVVPKPFCNDPADYVYVEGPVSLEEEAGVSRGRYTSSFRASGRLRVTPVNPLTGQPSGEPYFADISEWHRSRLGDDEQQAESRKLQVLRPEHGQPLAWFSVRLDVDSRGAADAQTIVRCTP